MALRPGVEYPRSFHELTSWLAEEPACQGYLERVRWGEGSCVGSRARLRQLSDRVGVAAQAPSRDGLPGRALLSGAVEVEETVIGAIVALTAMSPRPAIRTSRPWKCEASMIEPVISVIPSCAEIVNPSNADARLRALLRQ